MAVAQKLQEIVMRLAEDVQNVVRSEIELLKAEMREKAAAYGVAAGLAVGAAVLVVSQDLD